MQKCEKCNAPLDIWIDCGACGGSGGGFGGSCEPMCRRCNGTGQVLNQSTTCERCEDVEAD
jgi:hypothetical protein